MAETQRIYVDPEVAESMKAKAQGAESQNAVLRRLFGLPPIGIDIDHDLAEAIQERAQGSESPNGVLRRLLGLLPGGRDADSSQYTATQEPNDLGYWGEPVLNEQRKALPFFLHPGPQAAIPTPVEILHRCRIGRLAGFKAIAHGIVQRETAIDRVRYEFIRYKTEKLGVKLLFWSDDAADSAERIGFFLPRLPEAQSRFSGLLATALIPDATPDRLVLAMQFMTEAFDPAMKDYLAAHPEHASVRPA